ncbi:MAG: hypothetical protein ACI9V8_002084, partial [Urechidicola sp.]
SEIIEFVDEGWIVVQDFADIGKIDDMVFKDSHPILN